MRFWRGQIFYDVYIFHRQQPWAPSFCSYFQSPIKTIITVDTMQKLKNTTCPKMFQS